MAGLMLPAGTKEYLPITVKDRLENLGSLTGLTCQFRIVDDQGQEMLAWSAASTDGMTILPLVDTTPLPDDDYDIYGKVIAPPEEIIVGPFRFTVG